MDADDAFAARIVGQTVGGRWRLERLLGTGGMAAVYAARDESGNVAAIKLLHPEMSLRHDVCERFLREAYVANRVAHPGAVQVLEHSSDESGSTYLVMELLEGEPLSTRVRRAGKLPPAELLDYLDQILDVLVHAHEQGIIHRDLKPDNLFVTNEGRVKILDFGLARMLDDVPGDFKTRTGMALGTLPYMAPEQALGRRSEIDGRVDVFALGATAFRILAGRKVHEADSEAELLIAMASKAAPPLASVAPDTPPGLCAIVDLALAFSRDARYPDARTMQGDVRAVQSGASPPYASSRAAVREESTRLDMPAVPAAAVAAAAGADPASIRDPATAPTAPAARATNPLARTAGGTAVLPKMPAAAIGASTAAAQPPMPGAALGPESMRGSVITQGAEPMQAGAIAPQSMPGSALAAGPQAMAAAQAFPGAAVAGGAAPAVHQSNPPPARKRSLLPWLLAAAAVLLLIGGAIAAAAVYWVEEDGGSLPQVELPGEGSAAATSSAPPGAASAGSSSDDMGAAMGSGGNANAAADNAGGNTQAAPAAAAAAADGAHPAAAPAGENPTAAATTTPHSAAAPAPVAAPKPAAEAARALPATSLPPAPPPAKKPPKEKKPKGPEHDNGKGHGHGHGHGH